LLPDDGAAWEIGYFHGKDRPRRKLSASGLISGERGRVKVRGEMQWWRLRLIELWRRGRSFWKRFFRFLNDVSNRIKLIPFVSAEFLPMPLSFVDARFNTKLRSYE